MQNSLRQIFCLSTVILTGWTAAADPMAGRPDEEPVVRAVQRVLPAVVNINTEQIIRRNLHDPFDHLFHDFFGRTMRPPRQVEQRVHNLGSGFLIDPSGLIVTNDHVVARAANHHIHVTTHDGVTHRAIYLRGDPRTDLAFIQIEGEGDFPYVDLQTLSPNHLGQTVIVLGNPLGIGTTVTRGILSAHDRSVAVRNQQFDNLLQTDAAINPGNSGGPIIDLAGQLVGISSVKMAYSSDGHPVQGIGFAIPAETVGEKFRRYVARPAAETGEPGAPFGMALQDLTDELATAFGLLPGEGVLIRDVEPGGPADRQGLEPGLVIYNIGRHEINSREQAGDVLAQATPGTPVDFVVGIKRPTHRGLIRQDLRRVRLVARPTEGSWQGNDQG